MLFRSLICLSIAMFGSAFAAIDAVKPENVAAAADKADTVSINVEASPKVDELQAAATGYYAGPSYSKYADGKAADYGGEKKSDEAYAASGTHGYGHYGGGGGGDGGGHYGGYHHSYHGPPAFTPHGGHYGSKGHYKYEDHYNSGEGYGHGGAVYGHVSYSHDTYEFSCHGKHPSFYGDAGHECRVFHICQKDGRQDTFKCPKWTRFNNYLGVCDWHFKIDHSCNPIHKSYGGGHDGGYY